MIIDFHSHIAYYKVYPRYFLDGIIENTLTNEMYNKAKPKFKKALKSAIEKTLNDEKCLKLIEQMSISNINKTVLLITDLSYLRDNDNIEINEIYNIHRQILVNNPEKFIVFAGIDPRRGINGLKIFEKGIAAYGFRGLKLYPPCGFSLNDKCVIPFIEMCNHYKLPILIHTGDSLKGMQNDCSYVKALERLSLIYKNVIFVIAHATYSEFEHNISLASRRENIYLDISAFQNEIDNEEILKEKLSIMAKKVPQKILFGTDWPMYIYSGNQKRWVDYIVNRSIFSEENLDRLFYKNASTILNI